MKSALIITTYNSPDKLRLCLESVRRQRVMPDVITIADDGSDERTRIVVDEFRRQLQIPVLHVWQEDKGIRVARSRNNAAAVTDADYIIGIDGDLVLHRRFVADHIRFATPGAYLKGGRCKLNATVTERLCMEGVVPRLTPFMSGVKRKRANLLHCMPLARWLAPRYRRNKPGVLGCNESYYRSDMLAINGYDESYEGWGGEDTDFIVRLKLSGVRKLHLKFAGIACHLWHQERKSDSAMTYRASHPQKIRCDTGVERAIAAYRDMDHKNTLIIFPG